MAETVRDPYERSEAQKTAHVNIAHGNHIRFLGTAGSRWVVARQFRASGGTYLELEGCRLLMDPGPGSLVRCAEAKPPVNPVDLDGIIVTHRHIDHCNDVTILVDSMTGGGLHKRGALFAPASCFDRDSPILLPYAASFVERVQPMQPASTYTLGGLRFSTTDPHAHGSVETYGLVFHLENLNLAFLVDTRYFDGLPEAYRDADVLVVNVTLAESPASPRIYHLGIDDVRQVLAAVRPSRTILTHFGMSVLDIGPENVARQLSRELGLDILAAHDGMRVNL